MNNSTSRALIHFFLIRSKSILKLLLTLIILFSHFQASAEDWRYGVLRSSDRMQIDIDYDSIHNEAGWIVFVIRMAPEKGLKNLFSDKKFTYENYGISCSSSKAKWLSLVEENNQGAKQNKFSRSLADSEPIDIPKNTMLDFMSQKLCAEFGNDNIGKSKSLSKLAPEGIIKDNWIEIVRENNIGYFGKKGTLERKGDVIWFVTGRDNGKTLINLNGKPYRYEIQMSFMNCTTNMYSSGDTEYFDEYSNYQETIPATQNNITPKEINTKVGEKFREIMCISNDNDSNNVSNNSNVTAPKESTNKLATGTAWQVSKNHLVTAYHVVESANEIVISLDDGSFTEAELVTFDAQNDLAIIKIKGNSLKTKPLSLATGPSKIGSKLAVIGFPLPELLGTKIQATTGEVSALFGLRNDPRFYRMTASVQGGNSGGPVVNQKGEVIGIVTSKLSDLETLKSSGELPQNINFAIKHLYLQSLLESSQITSIKNQRKVMPIEDVIEQLKESVYLVIVSTK